MDELDRKIRLALPLNADVFIDVTANRTPSFSPSYGKELLRLGSFAINLATICLTAVLAYSALSTRA